MLARAAILLAALAVACLLLAGCRGTGAPQAKAA
jgi:predicted small secreted protein